MSLESYKNSLQNQEPTYSQYNKDSTHPVYESYSRDELYSSYHEDNPASGRQKKGKSKLIVCIIIIAVLFLAALKNPSKSEAKDEIKDFLIEKFDEEMRNNILNDEEENTWEKIGSGIAMLFAPAIFDYVIDTDISNFIFFSTFSASVTYDEETKTVVSGIILFGNIIPLNSDFR